MDAVIAVVAVLLFLLAFWKIGFWRYFWIGLALYLGIFEGVSVLITHHTISQQFWQFHAEHPTQGWIACGMIILGGIGLAAHLAWKQINKGRK